MKDNHTDRTTLSPERKKIELSLDYIQNLRLIDNDFFLFAADNNKEFAEVLIKPALNYLGIENYKIESVKAEVSYNNLKNHSVRIDCVIKLASGQHILIEIQNDHPEELPLKRIRYELGSFDTKYLEKGKPYKDLPEIISLIYTTEPLENHDTGTTVNDLAMVDLSNGEIASDFGIRILIVNGKYKNEDSKEFSDVIDDLQKQHAEDISNPIMKDIHLKTKNTQKGRTMFSDYFEELYGDIIRGYEEQHQKDQQQHQRDQQQHLKDQQELKEAQNKVLKYEDLLRKNGIVVD